MTLTYGAKCHRCTHIRHDGERLTPPSDWLQPGSLECADCSFCQLAAFMRLLQDLQPEPPFVEYQLRGNS